MHILKQITIWGIIIVLGVVAMAILTLNNGEPVNAVWIVICALCWYCVAYRFYSRFLAHKVFELDDRRLTPAEKLNDGLDYVPVQKSVLFGHHFAAIAGAGPLVGPVLAAQMGYLPGTLWLIIGVVFAGGVQDFTVLFLSTRRNGQSLGEMARQELGSLTGFITIIGILGMMIILLAALALIIVKALTNSPWGTFTIVSTIPIALLMGVYMRLIRPGKIAEVVTIGFTLLIGSIILGGYMAQSPYWSPMFTLSGTQLTITIVCYGLLSSTLPVWLLLAPRDYLATFLKIGVILGLAICIVLVMPELKMPSMTKFIDGSGPVFAGNLFPFLFITIACGAVSGFHSLIASGTTPKLIERESHIRMIGYGSMLTESFVGIMAMICATLLDPGVYFAINSPLSAIGEDVASAAYTISSWGFAINPDALTTLAHDIGENSILSRTGGSHFCYRHGKYSK